MASRAFSKIWMVIILIVVIIGVGYGALEYQRISGTIAKAKQLAEEKNYNQAIEELEFVQEKWIVKGVGIKKQEIKQLLKDRLNYENGVEKIREKDWEGARELFLSVSEKSLFYPDAINKIEVLEEILGCKYRKGEYKMKVFDSQGRVTGVVNGELKEEIPGSILAYDEETKEHTVFIYDVRDNYIYEWSAIKEGNYQFTLWFLVKGEVIKFYLENIPIPTGATHRTEVDIEALKEDRIGGILLIDADSDGEFEEEITFSKELTCEEFITRTKMPEIEIESSEGEEVIEDETAGWQTYRNTEYGFEIKYPSGFFAESGSYEVDFTESQWRGQMVHYPFIGVEFIQTLLTPEQWADEKATGIDGVGQKFDPQKRVETISDNQFIMFQTRGASGANDNALTQGNGNILFNIYRHSSGMGEVQMDIYNQMLSTFRFLE